MFVPLDRKPDWKNPPYLTLLLIFANVFVYFALQSHDNDYMGSAFDYYLSSDLPAQEFPRYVDYLKETGAKSHAVRIAALLTKRTAQARGKILLDMLEQGRFIKQLEQNRIIRPNDPVFREWRLQRDMFDERMNRSVTYHFGLKASDPTPLTLLTNLFLHGSGGHLFGNMLFLLLFGFVVEIAIGRPLYLFAYLLAGLSSDALYILFNPDSMIPAIGASGAVSGLAGMYTVLFGLRRIRFFYWVLFYFDYVRAPAIILLPLWLSYELYYQLFDPSNVNRLAHIGGLLGGALIAFVAKRYSPTVNHAYIDESDRQQRRQETYKQGMQHLAAMELDAARAIFEQLHAQHPEDHTPLLQLYNIAKLNPASEDFHSRAHALLALPGNDAATLKLVHNTYREYTETAQPGPRFQPEQLMGLAIRFAAGGWMEDAEKMVMHIVRRKPDFSRNPEAIMALANGWRRQGQVETGRKYLALLLQRYPDSVQAQHLRRQAQTAAAPTVTSPPAADTPAAEGPPSALDTPAADTST